MENQELHSYPDSKLPNDFFEKQHAAILQKTIEIENWQIPGTKAIQNCFPVPEGYWLEMEDGVRSKISPRKSQMNWRTSWFWAGGLVTSCIIFILVWFGIRNLQLQSPGNWEAGIQQVSQEELLNYVETQGTSVEELTSQMASVELPSRDLPAPDFLLNETETEEALDKIQEEDLESTTDWTYENNESI
jgi:hypothetical protein